MVLPKLWSRRKRIAEGNLIDVWNYVQIPQKLRIQFVRLVERSLLGEKAGRVGPQVLNKMVEVLRDEGGVHRLHLQITRNSADELAGWLESVADTDSFLDAIELWHAALLAAGTEQWSHAHRQAIPSYVDEWNARMKESGFGYQLIDGQIVKIANEALHAEAVLPALNILRGANYESANVEFRAAFEAFKLGDNEQCLVECCKALESTLKVIGGRKQWGLDGTEPLAKLISAAIENGLIPKYMLDQFTGLRNSLGAVGTIRNKDGGHGAGEKRRQVPEHLAAYQLHLTASAIVFLDACAK
jgi:hypothetical protein